MLSYKKNIELFANSHRLPSLLCHHQLFLVLLLEQMT